MADPSGKICLGFNMGNPDHEQVKKILDSLPKGAKSNFIVAAVLEYWVRHDKVIDARDYRKSVSGMKIGLTGYAGDEELPEKVSTASPIAMPQASAVSADTKVLASDPMLSDGGNNQREEDEKLEEILKKGLKSFM